jgi:hypothetical protein
MALVALAAAVFTVSASGASESVATEGTIIVEN